MSAIRRIPMPPGSLHHAGTLRLDPHTAHYVFHVLRLPAGTAVELFDGAGKTANATLDASGAAVITHVADAPPLPAPRVTLLCALSKGDKLDVVIEKASEAGAQAVWPVETERSVVKLTAERSGSRLERWERVARAASRQCGRDHVLEVAAPAALEEALIRVTAPHRRVLMVGHDTVLSRSLPERLDQDVALLVGPEGGLTDGERALAGVHGFEPAGLGPWVLRAETAPVVALAAVLARAGRM